MTGMQIGLIILTVITLIACFECPPALVFLMIEIFLLIVTFTPGEDKKVVESGKPQIIQESKISNEYSYCPYCGETLSEDYKFCPKCGKEVK